MGIENHGELRQSLLEVTNAARECRQAEARAQNEAEQRQWEVRDAANWQAAKEYVKGNFNKTQAEVAEKLQRAAARGEVKVLERWTILNRGDLPAASTGEMIKHVLMRDRLVSHFTDLGLAVDPIEEPFLVAVTPNAEPSIEVGMVVGLEIGWDDDPSTS